MQGQVDHSSASAIFRTIAFTCTTVLPDVQWRLIAGARVFGDELMEESPYRISSPMKEFCDDSRWRGVPGCELLPPEPVVHHRDHGNPNNTPMTTTAAEQPLCCSFGRHHRKIIGQYRQRHQFQAPPEERVRARLRCARHPDRQAPAGGPPFNLGWPAVAAQMLRWLVFWTGGAPGSRIRCRPGCPLGGRDLHLVQKTAFCCKKIINLDCLGGLKCPSKVACDLLLSP